MAFTFKGHGWGAERAPLWQRPDGRTVPALCRGIRSWGFSYRGIRSWGFSVSLAAARPAAEQGG